MSRRTYDSREKDIAMTAFALSTGSSEQEKVYKAIIAEEGLRIHISTARGWAYRSMRDRYMQIREEVADFTRAQVADDATSHAALAGTVVRKGLEQLEQALDNDEIALKELPKVVKESAVAFGINVDKAEKLNDRPTTRVAIDIGGTLRELKEMGMEVEVIEGEAEEEPDDVPALPAAS